VAKKIKPSDPKVKALRQRRCLNPHPQKVKALLFSATDFFDARDLLQVKYEMLRQVHVDGQTISKSAALFGLSRPSFYQAKRAFDAAGLGALLPAKKGPRRAHKLSTEVIEFLVQLCADDPALRPAELARRVQQRFGFEVHSRSVERALARQKKKRR